MRRLTSDPRDYQLAVLGALLVYGVAALDFEVAPLRVVVIVATALGCQWVCSRAWGLRFEARSAMISCLSLSLLLRTSALWVAALAAALTITSKFVIRARGKHVFNPANFGIVATILLTDAAWVSPGQWGSVALFAFAIAGFGGLVIRRAERSDVTWAFVAAWCAVLFGRAAWLGDPLAIPLHQVSNGAVLVFAFFMISDPKTTPDRRSGRILFAVLVAAVAGYIQFGLFRPNALIWALPLCLPLVPLIDLALPARRYAWPTVVRKGEPACSASPVPSSP